MGANTVAVTDATFDAEVRQSNIPVVVDFWLNGAAPAGRSARRWRNSRPNMPARSRS